MRTPDPLHNDTQYMLDVVGEHVLPPGSEATGLDPGYVWNEALRTATDEASKKGLLKEHYCPVRIRVSALLFYGNLQVKQ